MPLTARPVTPASSARRRASMKATPWPLAQASRRPTVLSPTPRLGTFSTRLMLTSSCGLTTAFR